VDCLEHLLVELPVVPSLGGEAAHVRAEALVRLAVHGGAVPQVVREGVLENTSLEFAA